MQPPAGHPFIRTAFSWRSMQLRSAPSAKLSISLVHLRSADNRRARFRAPSARPLEGSASLDIAVHYFDHAHGNLSRQEITDFLAGV